jgi:hypothetical protein
MCGDKPSELAAGTPGGAAALYDLVDAELDRLEKSAIAAQPIGSRHRGWVALPSDSGLSEAEEDFIDYWSPQRVLDDCRAKRSLLTWMVEHSGSLTAAREDQLSELVRALATGQSVDPPRRS